MCSHLVLVFSHNYLTTGNENFLISCLYHHMSINKTHVYLSSLHILYLTWGLCGLCHSLSPWRCNSISCHDWRYSMCISMWSAMSIARCPWSLWSYSALCHLTGWSLIPPATLLHSRRCKCLINRISGNTASSPWSLCPASTLDRCLFRKETQERILWKQRRGFQSL